MKAEYLNLSGHGIFVRYKLAEKGATTVFFIHGIGESGRCFFDAFSFLSNYNVIVPDLLGFGKSDKVEINPDYSFSYQMKLIWELVDYLNLKNIVLVGHSSGGILGTLLCSQDKKRRIVKFVNVEGGIARKTTIQSLNAVRVLEEYNHDMAEFGKWLREGGFKKILLEDLESASTIKYFDSVIECDPQAFAQTAAEICRRLESKDDEGINEISKAYREIEIPKIFCVGTRPVMDDAKRFLHKNNLKMKEFNVPSHWLMLDKREEFYSFLEGFIAT